jgi:gamma-butyrobetaine dioxygenase
MMTDAAIGERTVTLTWPDDISSELHYIWLRDNCACTECKHPDAWERLFDNVQMNLNVRPVEFFEPMVRRQLAQPKYAQ